jgi:hypothetical protein
MSDRRLSRNPSRDLGAVVALAVAVSTSFLLAAGCAQSEAAPRQDAPPAAVAGDAKKDHEAFVAEIKASGSPKAGAESFVEITLSAKDKAGYHINDKYPHKFKAAAAPDGVTYTKDTLQKADGTFNAKTGSFKFGFTAKKAGKYKIAGALSLSVCTDSNCVMEKVDLETTVEVK